jgi:hypothetical protein
LEPAVWFSPENISCSRRIDVLEDDVVPSEEPLREEAIKGNF